MTAQFGQVELNIEEYKNFLLGGSNGGYVYPVRADRVYVASELPEFFETAQIELERLLSQITPTESLIDVPDRENVWYEFHLLDHGKTGTNSQGLLTGWSGDMPCHTYTKNNEAELGGIELVLAQAGIMPEDDLSRELLEKQGVKKVDLDGFYLRFVSDLPRAIGHALLLANPDFLEELDSISKRMADEIEARGNLYDISTYQDLMKLALENGFIPTPLLRAQYYGPMELYPEKLKPKDKDSFIEAMVQRTKQNFRDAEIESEFNEGEVRAEAEDLAEALIHRKDPLFAHRSKEGRYITENRFDLFQRLERYYDTISKVVLGKKILTITSSGCMDVSPSYFRYIEDKRRIDIETPKKKVRGKVVVVKFGEYDGEPCYLNDPKKLDPIKVAAERDITRLRALSLDTLIRGGECIVETPLVGFRQKQEGIYEPYPEKLEDVLDETEPIIIFGHGGQGKSILATRIAGMFLDPESKDKGFSKKYSNVGPVLLNCGELNVSARPELESGTDMYTYLRGYAEILGLPSLLLNEHRFAFVIDDYQKLNPDFRREMEDAVRRLKSEGDIVILLSRMERTDVHPPHNPGYKTMQIDTSAIAEGTDKFIEGRIEEDMSEEFLEYAGQYDESVTGNYLTMSFLTTISPTGNGENKKVLDYIIDSSVEQAISEGRPLTTTELYEAQTDYITGCDVRRQHPDWGTDQVRGEIVRKKQYLAEKAFQDIFDQNEDSKK